MRGGGTRDNCPGRPYAQKVAKKAAKKAAARAPSARNLMLLLALLMIVVILVANFEVQVAGDFNPPGQPCQTIDSHGNPKPC